MKKGIMILSLFIVISQANAQGINQETEACINKVSQTLGLFNSNSSVRMNGNSCVFTISKENYISGISNLPVNHLSFSGTQQASTGVYPNVSLSIDSNEDLSTTDISECEVTDNAITLKFTGKQKFGNKRSSSSAVNLKLENGNIVSAKMISKSRGFFVDTIKYAYSCQ